MPTEVASGELAKQRFAEPDSQLSRTVRGAVAGDVGGAVFAIFVIWFTTTLDAPGKAALLMISTVATGSGSVADGTANVAVGVLVHLALSAAYGMIFAQFVPRMRTNATLLVSAGLYGILIYAINFQILSPLYFHAFQDANQPFMWLVHVIYGQLLAVIFMSRGVRSREPRFLWR